ncbi:acyltransferase family protein [Streptomyces sp. NPDC059524]|uniref:acyltransferase family protein n=1 Tax=Streptomyces sp. NPDC059524 TaxID=3346856 RepID=UPI0036CED7E2
MTQAPPLPQTGPRRPSAPPGAASEPPGHRADIQGLRAVAVGLVVLAHAGVRQLSGGYVGVDVFFVISGFLITSLLVRELDRDGRVSIRRFYARRALRLLPASTLVGVAALAGAYLFLSKARFTEYVGDAVASGLYAVNLRLAASGTDYLRATAPPSPFQHFWSLAVEEQFYVVWPLVLTAVYALARTTARSGRTPARGPRPGTALAGTAPARGLRAGAALAGVAVLAASLALSVATTGAAPSWAYFGTHTRAWELAAGALLALTLAPTRATRPARRLPAPLAGVLSWAGLAAIVGSALVFDDATPFPGYAALVPVTGTVLVLAGGSAPNRFGAELLLRRRLLTGIGGVSYGWYLWHWPLLVIVPVALGRPDAGVPARLAVCALGLGLAVLTLRLVENPVRFAAAFRGRPGRALTLGASLTAGTAAVALLAALVPPAIDSGRPAPRLAARLDAAPDPAAALADLLAAPNDDVPANLRPALTRVKDGRSAVYRDGCHVNPGVTAVPGPCAYGDPASATTVVLFGDSHAAQWFPALERLARERHWRLVSLTKASCKTADVTIVNGGGPYTACDTWRARALDRIAGLRPRLVIASSSESGDPVRPAAAGPVAQWTAGYTRTYRKLRATGARVVALQDTPWPASDAVDCASTHPLELDRCSSAPARAAKDPRKAAAVRAAARATGATLVDPRPWVCAPRVCPVLVADTLVYRDDGHLADAYARALAPVLGARLGPLPGTP